MLSQGQKSLDSLKKECTQRVHILRHNSERYAQGNSKVEAEIHQLDLQNSMRRTRTQSLLSQCKGLQDKVVNLTKEAATVDFGLADSIKIAEGKQAMHELENSMAHILNQLTPEPETDSVALMQVRPKALNRMSHAASDMARALEQHFQDVLETQTSFARTMFELEKDHEDLLAEQVSLHAKRDRLRTQGFHLVQLADRLDIIRQRLQDGVTALQKYQGSKKAGTNLMQNRRTKVTKTAINRNKRTNKHTAFVQLGHQARVVHKKDAGSFDAFESTSSRVSQLKQQLVEEELDHKQRMAMARRMLDQKLGEHERCVSDLEAQNTRIKKEIDELMQSSVQLRTSSSELEKDCALFREDVAALQHNLTTAQEYIKGTAEKANDILHDYDLSVLTELDDKDLQVAEANTRRNRAESIRSVRQEEGALLQVAAQPANKVDATMLLNVLHDDLNSLGESASSEEAALRSSYRVKFDDFHKRKKTLLTEQAQLNETKASMKKVNVMLQEAHNFLEKSRQSLEQRSRALRRFMQRLGIRPAPVGVSRRHALALAGAAANGHLNPGIYRGRHQEETIADNHKILDEETEDFDLTAGA